MDELTLIRDLLTPPPPTARATVQARARLTAAISGRPSHRRRWLIGVPVGGAAALAGVTALVLTTTSGAPVGPAHPGAGTVAQAPTTLSAHDILLAAAHTAGTATSGRYWDVESVGTAGPYRVGTAPHQYNLVSRLAIEKWIASDPKDKSWYGSRRLGYHPATAADDKAWRAAGSPRQWTIGADTPAGTQTLTNGPDQGDLRPVDESGTFLADLGGLSLAQVDALPTDPGQLRFALTAMINKADGPGVDDSQMEARLFGSLTELLLDVPAPPKVRAAAFAALADLPGMRSTGTVKDAEGRSGLGVELTDSRNGIDEKHQLVIDPASHQILDSSYSGAQNGKTLKQNNQAILKAEWTNAKPTVPTGK